MIDHQIMAVLSLVAAILSGAVAVRLVFDDRPAWLIAAVNLLACVINAFAFVSKVVPA